MEGRLVECGAAEMGVEHLRAGKDGERHGRQRGEGKKELSKMPPPLPWRSMVHQGQGDCLYVCVLWGGVCGEGVRDCRYACLLVVFYFFCHRIGAS